MHFHRLIRDGEHGWWVYAGKHARTIAKGWWSGPWRWDRSRFEVEVALGGEDGMAQLRVSIPFVGHAAAGVAVPRSWLNGWIYERREWSVRGPGGGAWAEVRFAYDSGLDGMAGYYRRKRNQGETLVWSRVATWPGWQWRLRPRLLDRIFGRVKYTSQRDATQTVEVRMPEGVYLADAALVHEEWKRPRSPRRRIAVAWDVQMRTPIPVPGKGENSWDCDDDAIHAMHTRGEEGPNAAAQAVARSAMNTRMRYANADWKPRKGWPEAVTA